MADQWINRACAVTQDWTMSQCGRAGGHGGMLTVVAATVMGRENIIGGFSCLLLIYRWITFISVHLSVRAKIIVLALIIIITISSNVIGS